MSDNTETFWLVMRVRRWDKTADGGFVLTPDFAYAFDTEAAAIAACQDGDTVEAVRCKSRAEETEEAAPTCARCGIEWEEGTGANEFGCWNCGSMRSVNVSPAEAKAMRIAYTRADHLRHAEREIKAGNYPRF